MREETNESTITPSSPVRLTVGLLATLALSIAYFLYDRDERFAEKYETQSTAHERAVTSQLEAIRAILKTKAGKDEITDRFTGADFRTYSANKEAEQNQFREFVRLQFNLTEKRNEVEHKALEQRIEHLDDDLNQAVERIDNHYNLRGIP
jgi:hypothetical protein